MDVIKRLYIVGHVSDNIHYIYMFKVFYNFFEIFIYNFFLFFFKKKEKKSDVILGHFTKKKKVGTIYSS